MGLSLPVTLVLAALLLVIAGAKPAMAQAPDALVAAATAAANAGLGATPVTTDGEEEAIYDHLPKKILTTPVPPGWEAPLVFVLDYKAPPPKKIVVEVKKDQPPPNADVVKKMFAQVKVSSISITLKSKIAVVSYQSASMRVHEKETVLGQVTVKQIEKDRVLFQYASMPPIWIYRMRPGMPAPEVVAQQ